MAAVAADPRMRSGVSRGALDCATPGLEWFGQLWDMPAGPRPQEALQVGKPGQNQEIEQHIDERRNEGDCKHRDLGETEPPENDFVAERTEPQQFGHPVEELEQDNKEIPPSNAKPTGERNKRREGLVKAAPTAQGIFSLSVTSGHAAHLPLPMRRTRVGTAQSHIEEKASSSGLGSSIIDPVTGRCLIRVGCGSDLRQDALSTYSCERALWAGARQAKERRKRTAGASSTSECRPVMHWPIRHCTAGANRTHQREITVSV